MNPENYDPTIIKAAQGILEGSACFDLNPEHPFLRDVVQMFCCAVDLTDPDMAVEKRDTIVKLMMAQNSEYIFQLLISSKHMGGQSG